jgi:hypothetical protein
MLAPDGRCKTFDARANGYARGEGCGVVVLKRLADALAANDHVLAVIRGSAVNQDGRTSGLTAPNGLAQQAVMRQALSNAGLAADHVGYIEAHGTGTSLGDPIEVEALTAVYGGPARAAQSVFLGAVKTNLGHLEAAAGMAGLIKAVLAIRHQHIPPNLHFQTLNPNITLAGTPFAMPTALLPWASVGQRRAAAVSSFGFGGTNAHVILEEAPALPAAAPAAAASPAQSVFVLPISAIRLPRCTPWRRVTAMTCGRPPSRRRPLAIPSPTGWPSSVTRPPPWPITLTPSCAARLRRAWRPRRSAYGLHRAGRDTPPPPIFSTRSRQSARGCDGRLRRTWGWSVVASARPAARPRLARHLSPSL